ncbi:hypothetical protein [Burkholderia sp. BCC1977]|uniref:hypothetical protein n=1 Tax=Burkholderia sp. BCC1977 TaxID=2817440 RepID=UPI002ABD5F92|nr:hypothetical protein [Burkholderia sp. BCC1977]
MVFILLRFDLQARFAGQFEDKTNPCNQCDSHQPIEFRDKFSIRRQVSREAPRDGAGRRLKKFRAAGEATSRAIAWREGPVNMASPGASGK